MIVPNGQMTEMLYEKKINYNRYKCYSSILISNYLK